MRAYLLLIFLLAGCMPGKQRLFGTDVGPSVFVVTKGDLEGLIDANGKEIIPAEHGRITSISKVWLKAHTRGLTKIFDLRGKLVRDLERQHISDFYAGFALLQKSDRSLYLIDEAFDEIKEIEANGFGGEVVNGFNEDGFAVISAPKGRNHGAGPVGVINHRGEVQVDYAYDATGPVRDGYWIASDEDGNFGVLNMQNQVTIPFEYEDIWHRGSGRFYVRKQIAQFESKYPSKKSFTGYWVDHQGREFIDRAAYDFIANAPNGDLISVRKGDGYGFVDYNGKEVIPPVYESAIDRVSPNGLIWVIKDGLGGFINYHNEVVIPLQFKDDQDCPPLPGVFHNGWTYLQMGFDCISGPVEIFLLKENNQKKYIGAFSSAQGVTGNVVILKKQPDQIFFLRKNGKLKEIGRYDDIRLLD